MITVTFSIITDNGRGRRSLGFLPIAIRFDTPEEAQCFLEARHYKQAPENLTVMTKEFTKGEDITGLALAVISQVTEPEGFFEDEINPSIQEMLS